jgi:hypothetical protein
MIMANTITRAFSSAQSALSYGDTESIKNKIKNAIDNIKKYFLCDMNNLVQHA